MSFIKYSLLTDDLGFSSILSPDASWPSIYSKLISPILQIEVCGPQLS